MTEEHMGRVERISCRVFISLSLVLLVLFVSQLAYNVFATSATVDEGAHILAAHRHLQCGDFGINPEHPPLLKLIAAVPLAFSEWKQPGWECGSRITPKPDMFDAGTNFIVENGADRVVIPARLAASLSALAMALLVFIAAREMFGRLAALIALGLVTFEPTLIGNGAYVLTDMAVTATAFAAVYAVYRYGKKKTWLRLAVSGLAVGFMLASKHSAVVFLPILLLLFAGDAAIFADRKAETRGRALLRTAGSFVAVFVLGYCILWAFYGFRYSSIPNPQADTISIAEYIKTNGRPEMVETNSAKITELVNRYQLFPEAYNLGMADVIAWGSRNSFLFGKSYPTGKWFYFPVAFSVKTSIPLLLLMPVALSLALFLPYRRREAMFLLLPALAYFAIAMTSSMTIGIRHLMPVYPFFIVAAAGGAVWLAHKFSWAKYVLALLFIYHVVTAVRIAPDYASFANDLWGGNSNTHRIFTDANAGFGQDLKKIADYTKRNNITDCWIAAFNHAALQRAMTPCRVLPSGLRILVSKDVIEPLPEVIEGTVFLSSNELPPRGGGEYLPIANSEQIDFLGGTIKVFRGRFEIPLAAGISRAYRSGQLLAIGSTAEALDESRRSVDLAPEDPRTHLAYGLALAKNGDVENAVTEFETVVRIAREKAPTFRNAELRALQELERLRKK